MTNPLVLTSSIALLCVASAPAREKDRIHHYSVMDAMRNGGYTGDITIGKLKEKGDFALGTFNLLDGELVALDGVFYRVAPDGSVAPAEDERVVPFAETAFFKEDFSFTLDGAGETLETLQQKILAKLPSRNEPYAIRIHCEFAEVEAGGANPVKKDDTTGIAEFMKTRPVYKASASQGVIVGFYNPPYMSGVNLTPFHFHYLSDDRKFGGHLITGKLAAKPVKVSVDAKPGYDLDLPQNNANYQRDWASDPKSKKSY